MHESSYDDCGCCADVHFGALLNQTSRLIRRALDARINAEVSSELSGVRGMVLGDIVRAERQGRDVYQRDIEQWFQHSPLQRHRHAAGHGAGWLHHPQRRGERRPIKAPYRHREGPRLSQADRGKHCAV